MLVEFVRDLWASAVDLRWYVIGALVVTAICQDVFNSAYLFWNRPVSSAPSIESDLDAERLQRGIRIFGPSLMFGKWWSSLRFIIGAPKLIERGYKQVNLRFFSV